MISSHDENGHGQLARSPRQVRRHIAEKNGCWLPPSENGKAYAQHLYLCVYIYIMYIYIMCKYIYIIHISSVCARWVRKRSYILHIRYTYINIYILKIIAILTPRRITMPWLLTGGVASFSTSKSQLMPPLSPLSPPPSQVIPQPLARWPFCYPLVIKHGWKIHCNYPINGGLVGWEHL